MPYRYQPPQRKKLSLSHLPYLLRHPYRLGRATSPPLPPLPTIMPWTNPSITNRSLPPLILLSQCNLTTVRLVILQLHPFPPTTPWTKQSISLPPLKRRAVN